MAIRTHGGIGRAAAALILSLAALGAAGCSPRMSRPIKQPAPAPPQSPPPVQSQPPPVAVTPPSVIDVTLAAASEAEARGDFRAALDLYERASGVPTGQARSGDIHYGKALLYADPMSGLRNVELARAEFQQLLSTSPPHPRAREAQSVLALIEEVNEFKAKAAELKPQLDALSSEVARLKDELVKKEQELKIIKQVLQQKKP